MSLDLHAQNATPRLSHIPSFADRSAGASAFVVVQKSKDVNYRIQFRFHDDFDFDL